MIEKKTAEAILESTFRVKIGGELFEVSPPRNSTVIRLSEIVAKLPILKGEDILMEVLENAKEAKVMADAIAILVCGEIRPLNIYSIKSIIKHYIRRKKLKKVRNMILYDSSPGEAIQVLTKVLGRQDVGGFFALITSLKETNILKKTKETKMTVYGQQSGQHQKH